MRRSGKEASSFAKLIADSAHRAPPSLGRFPDCRRPHRAVNDINLDSSSSLHRLRHDRLPAHRRRRSSLSVFARIPPAIVGTVARDRIPTKDLCTPTTDTANKGTVIPKLPRFLQRDEGSRAHHPINLSAKEPALSEVEEVGFHKRIPNGMDVARMTRAPSPAKAPEHRGTSRIPEFPARRTPSSAPTQQRNLHRLCVVCGQYCQSPQPLTSAQCTTSPLNLQNTPFVG
jgi:hypothetical protein